MNHNKMQTANEQENYPLFSFFKAPIQNPYPSGYINLTDAYKFIKSEVYLKKTLELRLINNEDENKAKAFKKSNFDFVSFSGVFNYRNANSLKKHSSLLTIDLDNLKDVQDIKHKLLNDEYFETELLFISPTGNGLKWIISIDLLKANHIYYFKAISNYLKQSYQLKVDPSGSDVARACFLPHDENIYINPKHL